MAAATFAIRTISDVTKSTFAASATVGPGSRNLGFPARDRSLTLHGGDLVVASIVVAPAAFTLAATLGTKQLTQQSLNAEGDQLSDPPTSWASSDGTKATVSSSGLVTGVATGSTNVTALNSVGSITSNNSVITVP